MRRQNTGNIRKWSGFGLVCEGTVSANDAKCAWQVVRGSGCVAEMLDDSTWSRFLDYPEHLKTWQYGMSERVLSKYESNLTTIEKQLGICWSGGEDGFHVHIEVHEETASERCKFGREKEELHDL